MEDNTDIAEIIQLAKEGDNEAFSRLYNMYFKPVYRYFYFRLGNKREAEDLSQDVFLKAYSSFENYSYTGKTPLAYLYTIARNLLIDRGRKKRFAFVDDDMAPEIPDDADTSPERLAKEQDASDLHKKIALLPKEQQEVIILRFINELSTKEIALVIGKKEEAVRQLQSRGLKSLRNIFNENEKK